MASLDGAPGALTIADDDPRSSDVLALLEEHLADMYATSPAESVHALDPDALAAPGIHFVAARADDGTLLGCAALKDLGGGEVELKSMRTTAAARGRGVGRALLEHLIGLATDRGLRRINLETGTEDYFAPARALYLSRGFRECPPFADYGLDHHSVFLTLEL
ncbi:GNAT family N-acetyltransferase [Nocardioides sp.]|uniref:GNAT family N-acetyltransferase n=1 Tax=Nocardioides sp. TaxID=35761 RepID=UPI0035194DC6